MAETILYLNAAVEEKGASIARLVRMLFGAPTEKAKNLPGGSPKDSGPEPKSEVKQDSGRQRSAGQETRSWPQRGGGLHGCPESPGGP